MIYPRFNNITAANTAAPASCDRFMKTPLAILSLILIFLCGCVDMGPFISKSDLGNLEVNLSAPEGMDIHAARLYVDDIFVGNISSRLPILSVKNGKHIVRVELEGAKPYQQEITILGDPNHQVLNVMLKKSP